MFSYIWSAFCCIGAIENRANEMPPNPRCAIFISAKWRMRQPTTISILVTADIIFNVHQLIFNQTRRINLSRFHEYISRKRNFNNSFKFKSLLSTFESDISKVRRYLFSQIFSRIITAKSRPSARKNDLSLLKPEIVLLKWKKKAKIFSNQLVQEC